MPSYSYKVKEELTRDTERNTCCYRAELFGIICYGAVIRYTESEQSIVITTEHPKVARRAYTLFKTVYGIQSEIIRTGKQNSAYKVCVSGGENTELIVSDLQLSENRNIRFRVNDDLFMTECCVGSFLRGCFLAGGSMIDPERNYHLEFTTNHFSLSKDTVEIIRRTDINAKTALRKSNYIVYLKDSEAIADMLGVMGATNSMMELYNIKIMKEMRNNVNRAVNCETKNLEKTTSAASEQIKAIKLIEAKRGLESLPDGLREIAYLRLENPEITLKELGELISIPIGKSGANHRLNKIKEIAEGLKGQWG